MQVKFPSQDAVLDSNVFAKEITQGLEAIQQLLMVCYTGDTDETLTALKPKAGYLNTAVDKAYQYAELGEVKGNDFSTDELHDLIAFTLSARVNGELYAIGVPLNLEYLIHKLVARAKIDRCRSLRTYEIELYKPSIAFSDREALTLGEVVLMSGMSEMAVRNATRSEGQDRLESFKEDGRVLVESKVAAQWLKNRQGFIPTRAEHDMDEDSVLVPFAKDGTFFCGNCQRKRGYQVGAKGEEVYIEDIYKALDYLKGMTKAKWRRPNEQGIPGIVAVAEWKPIKRLDFEAV